MIENFLRAPQSKAEITADVLRALGVLSVVLAVLFAELTDAGIIAFALPGLFAPRFLAVRAGADITLSVTLLIAAWSNVFDLYTSVPGWDLVVHFMATGVLAVGLYVLAIRAQLVSDPRASLGGRIFGVALTFALGLGLSAIWEIVEWLGYLYITQGISIGYVDTIGDMAAGGAGALCAGLVVVISIREDPDGTQRPLRMTTTPREGASWTQTS